MDFSRRDDGGGCTPCPFSAPGDGPASNPVYQSPPNETDPDCFIKTGDAFLSSLGAGSSAASNGITADECRALAAIGNGGEIFYALYELDQSWCGLGPIRRTGDDPTINSILTDCSSRHGIKDLVDPGWPSSTYQCTLCTSTQQTQTATSSSATSSSTVAPVDKVRPTSSSLSSTTAPPLPKNSSLVSQGQIPTQGIIAIVVCIALAISASLILLFCVLRRRKKQQEAMYAGEMSSSRISRRLTNEYNPSGGGAEQGDTYEPLISPSHSANAGDREPRAPLTPPPRLRDRRLLSPSLLRPLSLSNESLARDGALHHHHRSASSSLFSPAQSPTAKHDVPLPLALSSPTATSMRTGRDSSTCPSSPSWAPGAKQLEPRPERTHPYPIINTAHGPKPLLSPSSPPSNYSKRLRSPPPVSFTFPPRSSLDTSSINSNTCRSPPPPVPAARKSRHRRGTAASGLNQNNDGSGPGSKAFFSSFGAASNASDGSSSAAILGGGSSLHHHHSSSTPLVDPRALFVTSPTPPPSRPRRPHDEPLEIPDLVRPASPSQPVIGIAHTTAGGGLGVSGGSSIFLQTLAEGQGLQRRLDSWGSWEGGRERGEEEEQEVDTRVGSKVFGVPFPPSRP